MSQTLSPFLMTQSLLFWITQIDIPKKFSHLNQQIVSFRYVIVIHLLLLTIIIVWLHCTFKINFNITRICTYKSTRDSFCHRFVDGHAQIWMLVPVRVCVYESSSSSLSDEYAVYRNIEHFFLCVIQVLQVFITQRKNNRMKRE